MLEVCVNSRISVLKSERYLFKAEELLKIASGDASLQSVQFLSFHRRFFTLRKVWSGLDDIPVI